MSEKVTLNVNGQIFSIVADVEKEYILRIGEEVELRILEVHAENPKFSPVASATFAALNFCDDLYKTKINAEKLRNQIADYLKDSSNLRSENEKLKAEAEALRKQLSAIQKNSNAKNTSTATSTQSEPEKRVPAPLVQQKPAPVAPLSNSSRRNGQLDFFGKNFDGKTNGK